MMDTTGKKNDLAMSMDSYSLSLANEERSNFSKALYDIYIGTKKYQMWIEMALNEVKKRYQRTILGPFWASLSLAIFIFFMGLIFSQLWRQDVKDFIPYFSSGFISWVFVSSVITDGCSALTSRDGLLKQVPLPFMLFSWLIVARSFITFAHHMLVYLIIMLLFKVPLTMNSLYIIPAFAIVFGISGWLSLLISMLCARFRDFQQVINSLLQISMFVTPIFWPVEQLGEGKRAALLINGNPLYHLVSLIRKPLLGLAPDTVNWVACLLMLFIGWVITVAFYTKCRHRIIFWL